MLVGQLKRRSGALPRKRALVKEYRRDRRLYEAIQTTGITYSGFPKRPAVIAVRPHFFSPKLQPASKPVAGVRRPFAGSAPRRSDGFLDSWSLTGFRNIY